jgi:MFS family permease
MMLVRDKRLYQLLTANIVSSIGSGVTMIGVPWLLINRSGGEEIFGYASLCMTLLLFFASLYIGVWVDRVSRKKVLLHSQMFGFLIIAFFSGLGFTLQKCLRQVLLLWVIRICAMRLEPF